MHKTWPQFLRRHAQNLDDFLHLVALKGDAFLAVHFGFFAFEDGSEGEQFGEDAADGPEVDGGRVVPTSEEELRCAVPDCDDDFVAAEEVVQGLVKEAGEAEVADSDFAFGCYHNVGGLQVSV